MQIHVIGIRFSRLQTPSYTMVWHLRLKPRVFTSDEYSYVAQPIRTEPVA